MSTDVFPPGQILGGKYRVVRMLGEGGMAVVLEGVHVKLGHKVAIKVLRHALAASESVVSRFDREGRALSRLRSPNVVRVFDVDVAPNGAPFLVMEYLEGGDLEMELRARGALPVGEAVHYVLQACGAMHEAHALGIVHRDLKPTNIFLATEGKTRIVKVLDFGVATDTPFSDEVRLTQTETVMGTPLYMAPEQFRSAKDIDARADVWALGATLYELLTGAPPFTGSTTTIGVAIVTDDVRPIESFRPDVPPALRQVVLRALEKDRAKRFQTMLELADALRPFSDGVVIATRSSAHSIHDEHTGAAPTLLHTGATPATKASEVSPRAVTGEAVTSEAPLALARPRVARGWIVVAVSLAAAALIAGFLAIRGRPSPTTAPPQTPAAALPGTPTPPSTSTPTPTPTSTSSPNAPAPSPLSTHHPSARPASPAPHPPPPRSPPPDPSTHPLFFPK